MNNHGIMVLIPSRSKRFFFSPMCSDWLWDLPSLLFTGFQGRLGLEADLSHPSSAEVKNEWKWNYISVPPYAFMVYYTKYHNQLGITVAL
jgi:hypothetical protein